MWRSWNSCPVTNFVAFFFKFDWSLTQTTFPVILIDLTFALSVISEHVMGLTLVKHLLETEYLREVIMIMYMRESRSKGNHTVLNPGELNYDIASLFPSFFSTRSRSSPACFPSLLSESSERAAL